MRFWKTSATGPHVEHCGRPGTLWARSLRERVGVAGRRRGSPNPWSFRPADLRRVVLRAEGPLCGERRLQRSSTPRRCHLARGLYSYGRSRFPTPPSVDPVLGGRDVRAGAPATPARRPGHRLRRRPRRRDPDADRDADADAYADPHPDAHGRNGRRFPNHSNTGVPAGTALRPTPGPAPSPRPTPSSTPRPSTAASTSAPPTSPSAAR